MRDLSRTTKSQHSLPAALDGDKHWCLILQVSGYYVCSGLSKIRSIVLVNISNNPFIGGYLVVDRSEVFVQPIQCCLGDS